jgi:hypothetical protein
MVNMGLSIEDRLDIVELINRYNTLADERDVEGTLTCYTEDGQITGDFGTGEGKAAMREPSRDFRGGRDAQAPPRRKPPALR